MHFLKISEESFPFKTYKTHQREQLEALVKQEKILWEAPTGFGKTVIAITSTIPYLLNNEISKIFIFVRTKTHVYRILYECNKISTKVFDNTRRKLITVPLVAKRDLCIHIKKNTMTHVDCSLLKCLLKDKKLTDNLLDKIQNKLFIADIRKTDDYISLVKEMKDLEGFCPYYVLYPFVKQADIVITTHAWLTNANLKTIFEKDFEFKDVSNYGIILDEVHNFKPVRSIELKLTKLDELLQNDLSLQSRSFVQELKDFALKNINKLATYVEPFLTKDNHWKLQLLEQDYNALIESPRHYLYFKEIQIISDLRAFFDAMYDIWYIDQKIEEIDGKKVGNFYLVKEIVFPWKIFATIKEAKRSIYMSGTLFPLPAYRELYQIQEFSLVAVEKEAQNILYMVNTEPRLTSEYRNRTEALFDVLAVFILECHTINTAHTVVFNTSKQFSELLYKSVQSFLIRKQIKVDVHLESTSATNQQMIESLRYTAHDIIIATMGGSLSEGVEIKDPKTKKSKIRLVILTGIPFPPPNIENDLLTKLYTGTFGQARAELFLQDLNVYQKIQQSAGRGIRSHDIDYCAIICTDNRLLRYTIWKEVFKTNNIQLIKQQLKGFYEKNTIIDEQLELKYQQEKQEDERRVKLRSLQSKLV